MKDKDTVSPKPDFEKLAEKWSEQSCIYRQHLKEHYAAAFQAGLCVSWRDYVLPLQSRIAELERYENIARGQLEKIKQLNSKVSELEQQNNVLKRAILKGIDMYANLRFDDEEFTPHQLALQKIAELEKELCDTKANLGRAYNGIKHRDERLQNANEYLEREGKHKQF